MKAMDPGAPMISDPAGVIKDFISNTPSASPLVSKNSSTAAASPPSTPSQGGEKLSESVEKQNHVQNGESASDDNTENKMEKFNLPSSITVTSEKVPANVNETKRPYEDIDPKAYLKKMCLFSDDKNKNVVSNFEDFNRVLDKESKKVKFGNDIMCWSGSVTVVKSDDRTLNEKTKSEHFENVQPNSVPKQTDKNSDVKSALGNLPSLCDLEVSHENVKEEKLKLKSRVKKLPRKELEKIILDLFTEKVLYQCELGRQKQWCEKLETTLEGNRKKTVQFHKEIEELRKVTNKFTQDQANRKGQYVAPVRMKRSVGIQAAPHIIKKGLQHAQTVNSGVKTIATRTSFSPMKQSVVKPGRLKTAPSVTFNTKISPGNPPMHAGGASGFASQQPFSRSRAIGGSSTLKKTTVRVKTVPRPTCGGQMLMMTQPASGVMQAIPRPITAGQAVGGCASTVKPPTPGALVKVPVTETTQLVAIPQTGVVLPNASAGATLVISQVSGVQTVNSPIVAQSRTGTVTSTASVMGNSFWPISATSMSSSLLNQQPRHPAPLPIMQAQQVSGSAKKLPPQPSLKLSHKDNGIVLSWTIANTDDHEPISSYQLYGYQEGSQPPSWTLWKKVGSVKALELPMACTIKQFMPGHVYHFAVRAVYIESQLGPFSEPKSIRL